MRPLNFDDHGPERGDQLPNDIEPQSVRGSNTSVDLLNQFHEGPNFNFGRPGDHAGVGDGSGPGSHLGGVFGGNRVNTSSETALTDPGSHTEADSGPGAGQDGIPGDNTSVEVLTLGAPAVTNHINFNGDSDFYRVSLVAGQYYTFTMNPDDAGSLDAVLELRDTNGTTILSSADGPGAADTETVTFFCEVSGTYFLNADGFTTSTGTYTLVGAAAPMPSPLDAINWGGDANIVPGLTGDPLVLKVYFAPAGTPPPGTPGGGSALAWNAYEIQQCMLAFQQYSNVINVVFEITTDINEADFKMVVKANGGSTLGQMGPPNTGAGAGIGVFYRSGFGWDEAGGGGLEQGGFGFVTLTHEIGHGMGMAHPHDNGGGSGVMLGVSTSFGDFGLFDLNQGLFTVMSYNDAWDTGPNGTTPTPGNVAAFGFMGTLGAFDIAMMQIKYGANDTFNSGNNIYEISATDGVIGTVFYQTIWDTAGDDTIRYSGNADCVINLTAATIDYSATGGGSPSYAPGVHMAYTIAQGVVIERGTGGFGNDIITGNAANNTLSGRDANDALFGGDGGDILIGGTGSDTLNGGAGLDYASYINATAGVGINLTSGVHSGEALGDSFALVERYRLSAHVDTFTGSAATDYAYGAESSDTLNGAGGIDRLYGQDGNDFLNGDAGNDILLGGAGADTFNGGADRDTASYEESTIALTINLATGVHTGDALGDTFTSVEILWLSAFNDIFTGGTADDEVRGANGIDTMNGGLGSDILRGENGNDILNGDDGDDFLNGGANADALNGGIGVDTAVYLLATAGVTINLTSGVHAGEALGDTFTSIEHYQLSNGFTLADSFTGAGGDDWVAGYKGVDTINGMGGNDTINGGDHNDVINGGDGNDKLIGELGNDSLTGGTGADQFRVTGMGFGADTVTDFENGVDKIRVTGVAAWNEFADVVVSSNGSGWAVITFSDGSSITLTGTVAGDVDASDFLWI